MSRRRTVALSLAGTLIAATAVFGGLLATGEIELPDDEAPAATAEVPEPVPAPLEVEPPPGLSLPEPPSSDPVLAAALGPEFSAAAVRERLTPLLRDRALGRHVGVVVRDLARDSPVLLAGGADPFTPASTLKLFTAAAVLHQLGPEHRFTTRVVTTGRGAGRTLLLVGGGDPFLTSTPAEQRIQAWPDGATVAQLAGRTARALSERPARRVRVGYDSGLFAGPAVSRNWEPGYVATDVVSPISALWVQQGRAAAGLAERVANPGLAAAEAFAASLRARGIAVAGQPVAVDAPPQARVLAEQDSAELDQIVERMLQVSDNEAAEVLSRHVALSTDRPGSFAAGGAAVREVLAELSVPARGVRIYDGSGLSRDNRVTREALASVLQLGADPDLPDLRTVTTGLPVAAFSGSLAYRYLAPPTFPARGVVRAKTGTLTGVNGLAGTVVTRSGGLLGFGLLTDRVRPVDTLTARQLLEEMTAALARCGCRG